MMTNQIKSHKTKFFFSSSSSSSSSSDSMEVPKSNDPSSINPLQKPNPNPNSSSSPPPISQKIPKPTNSNKDFLTHLESFLARRDGVDKLLKITRYTSKLLLSSSNFRHRHPDLSTRLTSFESSLGISRKAFRLGKFIQDLNALRKIPQPSSLYGFLAVIAYSGEGVYYLAEQFVWLEKAGLLGKSPSLRKLSAWAEFIGYVGSVWMKMMELGELIGKEVVLEERIGELRSNHDDKGSEELEKGMGEIEELRRKRVLKLLSVVQDVADALMALADIRDGKGLLLSNPVVLASSGLVSALISANKNWIAC